MSTYVVTGGAGFIGSHIAEALLRQKHTVRIVDNFSTGKLENIKDFKANNPVGKNACTPNMAPWIKVLSPNGGEIFTAGQQTTIKWTSCNIPTTAQVGLVFDYANPNVLSSQQYSFSFLLPPNYTTVNDGSEVVTIPVSGYFSNLGQVQYHGLYKARIIYIQPSGSVISATSDNSFTIN